MWRGGEARQNFQADFSAKIEPKGIMRIWCGGETKQNHQAEYAAQYSNDGVLRVWRGGEVKQNFQAIATISNADEIPAAALVFVIVYLIGP